MSAAAACVLVGCRRILIRRCGILIRRRRVLVSRCGTLDTNQRTIHRDTCGART